MGHRVLAGKFRHCDKESMGIPVIQNPTEFHVNIINRLNPFGELSDPFKDDFFRSLAWRPMYRLMEDQPMMRIDLKEDDKQFVVTAELPGVSKEDIKVSIEGNQVSLSAEVKREKEVKEGEKVLRSERYHGRVARTLLLDESVDQAQCKARYENGVLELTLPKAQQSESKLLEIA
jgi:HSP20 family protein